MLAEVASLKQKGTTMAKNDKDYIGSREMEERLGVTNVTVIRMIEAGKIPAIVIGTGTKRTHYRVRRDDFEKFLIESKVKK